MKIPVFVSRPTLLNASQTKICDFIFQQLDQMDLTPHSLGVNEYPIDAPLREVTVLVRHCSGGLILGFQQFLARGGTWKHGTAGQREAGSESFPTPWNHLEAGILYALARPLLVFHEASISGGIFDHGATGMFVHALPKASEFDAHQARITDVLRKWRDEVRKHFYQSP
jgi:hypothetical protein